MINKNFMFKVSKCDQKLKKKGDLPCKSETEINNFISNIQIDSWNIQDSISFKHYGTERPVYQTMDIFGSWLLDPAKVTSETQYFRYHKIEAMNNFLFVDIPSYEGTFFQLGKKLTYDVLKSNDPKKLFEMYFYLQPESIYHKREIFNALDLVGELGGVIEVFVITFSVFLGPVSYFSFILKATKILFLARTEDGLLFEDKDKGDGKPHMFANNKIK